MSSEPKSDIKATLQIDYDPFHTYSHVFTRKVLSKFTLVNTIHETEDWTADRSLSIPGINVKKY